MENLDWNFITSWHLGKSERQQYLLDSMIERGFTYIGHGRTRIVFLAPHKRFVVKFPLSSWGQDCNNSEHKIWHQYFSGSDSYGRQFAPCRLINKIALMMRTVRDLGGDTDGCDVARKILGGSNLANDYGNYPYWVDDVDAFQVGKLLNGRIVAYDFSEVEL